MKVEKLDIMQADGKTRTEYLITEVEKDEPIVPFRARDSLALAVLSFYRSMVLPGILPLFRDERASTLEKEIAAFVAWRKMHAIRDPD